MIYGFFAMNGENQNKDLIAYIYKFIAFRFLLICKHKKGNN